MPEILIVEDSAVFRRALKETLATHINSIMISEAAEGTEALEKINSFCPDIVFMDVKLPGENGFVLTKKVKTRCPHTVVIIITSHDSPEYREAAQECGAEFFVSKGSSTAHEIISLVKSILPGL
ncbi:MAG TPA: response regulator transcription factor [Desulfobacterales bacterium]|nr:response regulator transcription factor [Desulfobacterales bacterium]